MAPTAVIALQPHTRGRDRGIENNSNDAEEGLWTHHHPPARQLGGVSRRALVMIDMSVDQWAGVPAVVENTPFDHSKAATLSVVQALLANTTTTFDLIVDTRLLLDCGTTPMYNNRTPGPRTKSGSLLCNQWHKAARLHTAANYPGAALIPELRRVETAGKVTFVAKQEHSSFVRSTLDAQLRANGIDEVFLVGINTDVCIMKTALDAWERGYRVVVVDDGCTSDDGGFWGHRKGTNQLSRFWNYDDGTWAIIKAASIPPRPVRTRRSPWPANVFAEPAPVRDHLEHRGHDQD